MSKPGCRYEFFISYLFSLQVVTGFTYVFAQIVLFSVFQQISAYFNVEIEQYNKHLGCVMTLECIIES